MRIRSLIGLLAMLSALVILGIANRARFANDTYVVCLGKIGDGPMVTESEKTLCACMGRRAVEAVPWKSWLPQSMIDLNADDNARMIEAQRQCRAEVGS